MQSSSTVSRTPPVHPPPAPPTVLIVDDYQDCREMYAAYLALTGFRVVKAKDGWEALDAARRCLPDVILMDLSLPGLDGFETTRRLKRDPRTRDLVVVALTAQTLPSLDTLRDIGFESVILKPCLPDELAERVESFVGQGAAARRRG